MVGVETVLQDDPLLNTRLPEGGRDPLRVVVDSHLRMPETAAMLSQVSTAGTLIATTDAAENALRRSLEKAGAEVVILPADDGGRVVLPELWKELGRRDVQTLLLEGGSTLAGAALKTGLIDRMMVFVAPKLIGGTSGYGIFRGEGCALLSDAFQLDDVQMTSFENDILISGEVVRCSPD